MCINVIVIIDDLLFEIFFSDFYKVNVYLNFDFNIIFLYFYVNFMFVLMENKN